MSARLHYIFLRAAHHGDTTALKNCIASGVDVNAVMKSRRTALIAAAEKGRIACVTALVEAGAKVNTTMADGVTAAIAAAQSGHIECMITLIRTGSREVKRNQKRVIMTPLSCLAVKGDLDGIMALLAEWGGDAEYHVNATILSGWTALMCAAVNGKAECVRALIKAGAKMDVQNNLGNSALMLAVEEDCSNCVAALMKAGADYTLENAYGISAVAMASMRSQLDIYELLLLRGGRLRVPVTPCVSG